MSTETDAAAERGPNTDVLPRDPAAYRPGIHFGERFKDIYDEHNRHLDGDIVAGCIKHGTATNVHGDKFHLRETFGGVTYRLVVNPGEGVVVTGHPISINTEAAHASARWTSTQIEDIHDFLTSKPPD